MEASLGGTAARTGDHVVGASQGGQRTRRATHRKETNGFAHVARCPVRPGEKKPTQSDRPCGIPTSVWLADGESSARILMALLNTTRVLGRYAVGMRGGRVQELYKHKGDRNETKSHRGILVQDLPGAIHA